MAALMSCRVRRASTAGSWACWESAEFFFGSCSSAADPSWPPHPCSRIADSSTAAPTAHLLIMSTAKSNRCAALWSVLVGFAGDGAGVAAQVLERGLAAVVLDELVVVLVGDRRHD